MIYRIQHENNNTHYDLCYTSYVKPSSKAPLKMTRKDDMYNVYTQNPHIYTHINVFMYIYKSIYTYIWVEIQTRKRGRFEC